MSTPLGEMLAVTRKEMRRHIGAILAGTADVQLTDKDGMM